jgi:hypothetical protein
MSNSTNKGAKRTQRPPRSKGKNSTTHKGSPTPKAEKSKARIKYYLVVLMQLISEKIIPGKHNCDAFR